MIKVFLRISSSTLLSAPSLRQLSRKHLHWERCILVKRKISLFHSHVMHKEYLCMLARTESWKGHRCCLQNQSQLNFVLTLLNFEHCSFITVINFVTLFLLTIFVLCQKKSAKINLKSSNYLLFEWRIYCWLIKFYYSFF